MGQHAVGEGVLTLQGPGKKTAAGESPPSATHQGGTWSQREGSERTGHQKTAATTGMTAAIALMALLLLLPW